MGARVMPRFLSLVARFGRDERGVFAVLFGVMAIVLVALGGAAVDYMALEQARNRTQIALDAATLALQPLIFNEPVNVADIRAKAQALLLDRLGIVDGVNNNEFGAQAEITNVRVNVAAGSLTLDARMWLPTMFVSLVGVQQLDANMTSQALRMMLDLEVAMVLDNSGSMAGSRMTNLKVAARCATNILLFDAVNDTTCLPISGATVKNNVKIGLVPFTLMVNIGTQFKNSAWLDWAGTSPLASQNFDDDDNALTAFGGPVSRTNLFAQTSTTWSGCVEARQSPYDTTDEAPNTPAKKFLPLFSPDTYTGLTNSYLSDTGGNCPVKTCTRKVVERNCTTNWRGDVSCSGTTTTTYAKVSGSTSTTPASSCVPSPSAQLDQTVAMSSNNTVRTTTTTFSLLTPRELQERLCKYNGTRPSSSSTNADCPATAILPLTNTPATVTTRINQMVADGNTNIQQGTIWGVHMLTNSEPLNQALVSSDSVAKVLIVMTDGENYPKYSNDMNGSGYFSWGFRWNNRMGAANLTDTQAKMTDVMDTKTLAACTTAKSLGIRVYVVGLAVPANVKDLLDDCASGPAFAFFPQTPGELVDDFKEIADRLAPLRLAQ